ncbi:MAG: substrate-binding domain-containing protein [Lysobacteraceae bacterium]
MTTMETETRVATRSWVQWAAWVLVMAWSAGAVAAPRLCLSGSNTLGEKLAPALVKAWAQRQGWVLRTESRSAADETRLLFAGTDAPVVDVFAHGTSTGFAALRDGQCDIWMASRPVREDEIAAAASRGRLYERGQEHVVALDGLAVIVHPSNPIGALTVAQVRDLFAGRVRDWSRLGGRPGAVVLHARDDRSGTYDTFRSLVMGDAGLAPGTTRYESTEQLAAAVAADPNAIGVVGLAGIGGARAVALSDEDTRALPPTSLAVATEDYLLSRRLLFYTAQRPSADAQAFVEFAVGAGGQDVVRRLGFVPQGVSAYDVPSPGDGDYAALVAGARRVALNFRFGEGIALLDNKALEDVDRLARFLRQPAQAGLEIVLVGFADRSEITPYAALSLSNDRVDLVAEALRREGLRVARQRGLGQIAPVASNATVPGRQRNRRVEVWLRPMAVTAGQAPRRPVTSSGG